MTDGPRGDRDAEMPARSHPGWTVGLGSGAARARGWLDARPTLAPPGRGASSLAFWFTSGTVVASILLAAVSVALVDLASGAILLWRLGGLRGVSLGALALFDVSHVWIAGGALAILGGLIAAGRDVCRRARLPRALDSIVLFASAAGALAFLNRDLFSGHWIANLPHVRLIEIGFWIVTTAILALAVRWVVRHFTADRPARRPRAWLGIAALSLALALALHLLDATRHTGGYPHLHTELAIAAFLLHVFAWLHVAAALEDRAPRSFARASLAALGVCLAATAVAVHLRGRGDVHVLRGHALHSTFPVAKKVLSIVEPSLLDRLRPLSTVSGADVSEIAEKLFRRTDSSAELDAILGPQRKTWNVVIISADTVRRDAVGFTGAPSRFHRQTPNIDRLAAQSLVFDRAYTPYPTSNYAYSSMLTGFYPRWTPARREAADRTLTLPEKPSIAEELVQSGWHTWAATAFNTSGVTRTDFFGHVKPGFEIFNRIQNEAGQSTAEIVGDSLDLLQHRSADKPFFLWMHLMEPHEPYDLHPEFPFGKTSRDYYDGEISIMDKDLGPMIDALLAPPLAGNTIVVFFSDHGESFGEHNTEHHNNNLFDVETRVPFALRIPGQAPRHVPEMINLVDIAPTLESVLGLPGRPRMGRDIVPLVFDLAARRDWVDFSYSELFPRDVPRKTTMRRCLVYDGMKIVRTTGDSSFEVYDLERDPDELENIAAPQDARQRRLVGLMDAIDLRIDSFLGAKVEGSGELFAHFDMITSWLVNDAVEDDYNGLLSVLLVLFDQRTQTFRVEISKELGLERMARLREGLLKVFRSHDDRPDNKRAALFILTNLAQPELLPFMRALLGNEDDAARLAAALWLARQGIADGRDILIASLAPPEDGSDATEWQLTAATALAGIGETTVAPQLVLGLVQQDAEPLAQAIEGLGRIGYPDLLALLRERYDSGSTGWFEARVERALLRVAAARGDDEAAPLLLRLGRARTADVHRGAREALGKLLAPGQMNDAFVSMDRQMLGDDAMQRRQYADAAEHLTAAREGLGSWLKDDVLATKAARAQLLAGGGARGPAMALLHTLVDDPKTSGFARAHARALLAAAEAGAPIERVPASTDSSAHVLDGPQLPGLVHRMFRTKVRFVNLGDSPLVGGVWSYALRLVWSFRNEATHELYDPGAVFQSIQNYLPEGGLEPHAAAEWTILGRTPDVPGTYNPVLHLSFRPWHADVDKVLATLPPIVITQEIR